MIRKNTSQSSGGTDVLLVLQIIFIVLKLVNVVDWSWWVVLIPTWISLLILLVAAGIITYIKRK